MRHLRFPFLYFGCATLFVITAQARGESPRLHYECSWIGNSDPGAKFWVPQDIDHLCVAPDGRLFSNVHWDEGGGNVTAFQDGKVLGNAGHTHGWGYTGGYAVAANSKYLFIAQRVHNEGGHLIDPQTWPPKGKEWIGVSRRKLSNIRQPAPFSSGKGGKGDTLKKAFLVVDERIPQRGSLDQRGENIAGLWATESRLYVCCPYDSTVKVFHAESMQRLAVWAVERPDCLAMNGAGELRVLQRRDHHHSASIISLDHQGQPVRDLTISLQEDAEPTGICFDPEGRLLVADAGPRQQVLIYEDITSQPTLVQTFGKRGGALAFGGVIGRLRFNDPSAIACDSHGNISISHGADSGGGSSLLESYRPDGRRNWQLAGLEFVDLADTDPESKSDVFTKEEHFTLDYNRPVGQEWKYTGYTIDRFHYPDDPRLHIWSAGTWIRRLEGRRFQFVTDMNANVLQVYRFAEDGPSQIAIPSGLFMTRRMNTDDGWPAHQPEKGEWIWRDRNGNGAFDADEYETNRGRDTPRYDGWWVDAAGNVWLATEREGIRLFPFQGLDAQGNPRWSYASMRLFPHRNEFKQIKRLRYDPTADAMYLGGTTEQHKNQHWKPMGPVICRYDNWSTNPKLAWRVVLPYATGSHGHSSCEPMCFEIAGDYLFSPYTGADRDLGFSTGHVEVLRCSDGSAVGHMEPSAEVGEIGLQDIRESARAVRRSNGEYLIFVEDDFKAKVLMYRWKPKAERSLNHRGANSPLNNLFGLRAAQIDPFGVSEARPIVGYARDSAP